MRKQGIENRKQETCYDGNETKRPNPNFISSFPRPEKHFPANHHCTGCTHVASGNWPPATDLSPTQPYICLTASAKVHCSEITIRCDTMLGLGLALGSRTTTSVSQIVLCCETAPVSGVR